MTKVYREQDRSPSIAYGEHALARIGICIAILTVCGMGSRAVRGEDWPQFLGLRRDGTSQESNLATAIGQAGLARLWSKRVGDGFAGPVVVENRLILFHQIGEEEVVECLDATTGGSLWKSGYASDFGGGMFRERGPRGTPTIAGGQVVTFGGGGVLACFDLESGEQRWRRSLHNEYRVPEGFFGVACSPLVFDKLVLVNLGATEGAGLVAIDRKTGKTVWTATSDEAGYSSPVLVSADGEQQALFFARSGLHAVDPATGEVRSFLRWRARIHASVNAATPIVVGQRVFISSSYSTGAALVQITHTGCQPIWKTNDVLDCHYNTPVHHNGFLYGIDGRQEHGARLVCVELATGRSVWTNERYGCASVILADGRLWILSERGTLEVADATPEAFRSRGKMDLVSGVCRAHPALANGRFYARGASELVCLNLRAAQP